MRHKRPPPQRVPVKFRRYRPAEWDSPGAWIREREAWNAAQAPVLYAGRDAYGNPYSYLAGPLGDSTDLARARHEAWLIDAGA